MNLWYDEFEVYFDAPTENDNSDDGKFVTPKNQKTRSIAKQLTGDANVVDFGKLRCRVD